MTICKTCECNKIYCSQTNLCEDCYNKLFYKGNYFFNSKTGKQEKYNKKEE